MPSSQDFIYVFIKNHLILYRKFFEYRLINIDRPIYRFGGNKPSGPIKKVRKDVSGLYKISITFGNNNNLTVRLASLRLGNYLIVIGKRRMNYLTVSIVHGLEHDFPAGAHAFCRHFIGQRHKRLLALYAVIAAVQRFQN